MIPHSEERRLWDDLPFDGVMPIWGNSGQSSGTTERRDPLRWTVLLQHRCKRHELLYPCAASTPTLQCAPCFGSVVEQGDSVVKLLIFLVRAGQFFKKDGNDVPDRITPAGLRIQQHARA